MKVFLIFRINAFVTKSHRISLLVEENTKKLLIWEKSQAKRKKNFLSTLSLVIELSSAILDNQSSSITNTKFSNAELYGCREGFMSLNFAFSPSILKPTYLMSFPLILQAIRWSHVQDGSVHDCGDLPRFSLHTCFDVSRSISCGCSSYIKHVNKNRAKCLNVSLSILKY